MVTCNSRPAVIDSSQRLGPAISGGPSEEAATPGHRNAKARFWKPSWRFTLENRQVPPALPQSRQRFRTSHACTDDTVKQSRLPRNGKLGPPCAEAVEDRNSFWKRKEN